MMDYCGERPQSAGRSQLTAQSHLLCRPASAGSARLPPILLYNPAGIPLNTNTSYQQAISESCKKLSEARQGNTTVDIGPNEWRLPHAPVPARPDYSRAIGSLDRQWRMTVGIGRTNNAPTHHDHSHSTQTLAELATQADFANHQSFQSNVAHTSEERQYKLLCQFARSVIGPGASSPIMPSKMPTRSEHHSYLPFVGATPLDLNSRIMEPSYQRFVASTDRRLFAPEMCLDAMCGGCRKHRIGFTFCYGCERDSYPHYHQDKTARTGGGFTYVKRDRPVREIVRNNPLSWRIVLDNGCVVYLDGEQASDIERLATTIGSEHLLPSEQLHPDMESAAHTIQTDIHAHLKTTTPTSILSDSGHEDEGGEEDDYDVEKEQERVDLDDADERLQQNEMLSDDSRRQKSSAAKEIADDSELAAKNYNADQPRGKLYTAPKAFAIKKGNRQTISSTLPFTTDRDLKIPNYGDFDIKKSDKGPTQFVSIDRGDDSWQAPDAFELAGRENMDDNWTHGHLTASHESDQQPTRPYDQQLPVSSAGADTLTSPPTSKTKIKKTRTPVGAKDKHKGRQQKAKGEGGTVTPDSGVGSVSNKPLPPIPATTSPLPEEQVSSAETHNNSSLVSREAAEQQSNISSDGAVSSSSTHTAHAEVDAMIDEVAEQFVTTDSSSIPKTPAISTAGEPVIGQRPSPKAKADEESHHRRPKTKEAAKRERKPDSVKRIKAKHDDEYVENKQDEERNEEVVLTPEPAFEPMVFKEHILPIVLPTKHVEHPPLPTASPPSLPRMMDFIEPVKPVREISVTQLEVPPPMMEPPRQRRPPPTLKPKSKPRRYVRPPTIRSGGAPIQVSDVKNMGDPLDFLAKYCIIHPDRLPLYARVFNKAVNEQMYRYSDVPHPEGQFFDDDGPGDPTAAAASADLTDDELIQMQIEQEQLKTMLTEDEATKIRNFTAINPSLKPSYASVGLNEGDQTLVKINYTLDILMDKYEALQATQDVVAGNQMNRLAYLARKHFPQLADPSYKPPKQKKKKKKAKRNVEEGKCDEVTDVESVVPVKLLKLTDADIIKRLDDKQLQALNVDMELSRLNLELQRLQEKLQEVDDRIEELEDEKKLIQLYARDEFQRLELCERKSAQFLRQQSALYQKMHPACNVEMNVSDIEEALQEINGHLITKKEMQYIFHILNIPGRKRIDIQLFSVIAAMSEKVAQVDPFIRKLINKFDYEALSTKMDRSKELFCLLSENETDVPLGKIAARMLAVELAAGGVTPEHTQYVLSKFNRENNGIVDILDFLTYVPLFIEIHDRILSAPLQLDREW